MLPPSRTDVKGLTIFPRPNLRQEQEALPWRLFDAEPRMKNGLPSIRQCLQRYSTPYGTSLLYSPALLLRIAATSIDVRTEAHRKCRHRISSVILWSRNHRKVFWLLLLLFLCSSVFTHGRTEAHRHAAIFLTIGLLVLDKHPTNLFVFSVLAYIFMCSTRSLI